MNKMKNICILFKPLLSHQDTVVVLVNNKAETAGFHGKFGYKLYNI